MRILVLVLSALLLSFFVVFAFHAQSPLQHEVKSSLESGGEFPFSAQANDHMRDVFDVLVGARVAAALLVVLLLWLLPSFSAWHLRLSGGLLVLGPLAFALVSWDWLFAGLHAVLFPQGNWRFPADSTIIRTYPQEFFVSFSIAWMVLLVILGTSLFAASYRWDLLRHSLGARDRFTRSD